MYGEKKVLEQERWAPCGHHETEKGTNRKEDTYPKVCILLIFLVRPTRIELVAYSLGGCRSIQLSYERAMSTSL